MRVAKTSLTLVDTFPERAHTAAFTEINWCEERSASLIGRVTIHIRYMGIILEKIGVHQQRTRLWGMMPALTFERDGKRKQYAPLIRFESHSEHDGFSELALETVNESLSERGLSE